MHSIEQGDYMEHARQACMASNRKGTKPEESVLSCSGKMSRTGEQYGCSLELLPKEMVVSIFSHLPIQDLLACRAVCKRFVRVIDTNFFLIAKAFCKKFAQPPDPLLFGKDRYKQVLRPWLEAFVTAQQRLTGGASDDLHFSNSQVEQLDRLIEHREFPKALFFIQAKTLQNAESLYFQEKISDFCTEYLCRVCFSPDGRCLLVACYKLVRFMVFNENDNIIWKYNKFCDFPVKELRFSPNSRSLLILSYGSIMIMGLDGEEWVQKGEIRNDHLEDLKEHFGQQACFSPDSDGLVAAFHNSVRIMKRDEKGNWVQNSEISIPPTSRCAQAVRFNANGCDLAISDGTVLLIMAHDGKGSRVQNPGIPFPYHDASKVCFSPDGNSLAISASNVAWIVVRDGKGNWVQNSEIPLSEVKAVCFSPDDSSLAILHCNRTRDAILIMRSDEKANWVQNLTISCDSDNMCHSLKFSPDGRNLVLKSFFPHPSLYAIGLDRANSRVYKYKPFLLRNYAWDACAFSPDGGSLAIGCDSATWVMGLDKGKWVKKACISDERRVSPSPPWLVESSSSRCPPETPRGECVSAVCFSPDGRRLAIISSYGEIEYPSSRVDVYEIKTGAKVLTDRDNQFLKGFFPHDERVCQVAGKE